MSSDPDTEFDPDRVVIRDNRKIDRERRAEAGEEQSSPAEAGPDAPAEDDVPKAEALLRDQYAAVGAAARTALPPAVAALEAASTAGLETGELLARTRQRADNADAFVEADLNEPIPVAARGRYDVVVAGDILEHVVEPHRLLTALALQARALVPF